MSPLSEGPSGPLTSPAPYDLTPGGEPLKLGQHARKLARSIYSGSVTAMLREAIIGGRLSTGTALVERSLAEQLQVSRGPIRNALYALEGEGLVQTLSNGRMVVNEFGESEVSDLLSVRYELESTALRWAGERSFDLTSVLEVVTQMEAEGTSTERLVDLDINFHRALVELSDSKFLLQSWLAIAPVVHTVIALGNRALERQDPVSNFNRIMKSHRKIVTPLKKGNTTRAAEQLAEQFQITRSMFAPRPASEQPGE